MDKKTCKRIIKELQYHKYITKVIRRYNRYECTINDEVYNLFVMALKEFNDLDYIIDGNLFNLYFTDYKSIDEIIKGVIEDE